MKKYIKYFSYLFLLISNIILLLLLFKNKSLVSIPYLQIIAIYIIMAFIVFFTGLIINTEKAYKFNIKIYIILYIICLLSVTIFDRVSYFTISPVKQLLSGNFIPFNTINRYIRTMYLPLFLRNVVANMLCLIPLSFLLIVLNDKYKNILKQLPVLLVIDIGIEVLQGLTGCGICDIDDLILNVGFSILFTLIFNRLIIKIKPIFYKDYLNNKVIKYVLLIINIIIVLIFDIFLLFNCI